MINFITFVALYFFAFMVCFGFYSLFIMLGWLEDPQPPDKPPDNPLNEPVNIKPYTNIIDLNPTVKKEKIRVRIDGVLRLVDVEDIIYYEKQNLN